MVKVVKTDDNKNRILLDFMRNYKESKISFIFPNIEDRMFVPKSQIEKKIILTSSIRNVFVFDL